jgi:hypothetical protein
MVVEIKRMLVEKKVEKERVGAGWPHIMVGQPSLGLHSPPTFSVHLILFPSCSNH